MPRKPARPCRFSGCPDLTTDKSGYCEQHLKLTRRFSDSQRGNAAERGYDARWRRYRRVFLGKHPLCVHCLKEDRTVAADVVDHIIPHKGDMKLFWNPNNHQALCKPCHDRKTAAEDGGFGNG